MWPTSTYGMLSFSNQSPVLPDNLQDSCKQHLHNASLNILKDISAAALSKTKALQRELHIQRDHLLRDYEETAVKTIWKQVKERMVALEIDLKIGPAFCPVPKDVNWQKVTDDIDKFERRIRLAVFFHGRNAEDNPRVVDDRFPAIPSASQWMPPKSSFPEVEVFLNNVKNDILKPANLRTTKDNLTREERLALRSLKSSENVIRIQDKSSRFVVLSQQEYQNKILGQLNNDLHYDSVDSDPTLDHFEVVKEWSRKWFSEGQISQEIATWVVNLEPKPGVAFGNVKSHKRDNPLRLITSMRYSN